MSDNANPENVTTPIHLKRVLVPTDFSDCSKKAVRYASSFAKQFGAKLYVVHVVNAYTEGAVYGEVYFPVYEEEFVKSSDKMLSRVREEDVPDDIEVETLTRSGNPVVEICDLAKKESVDLVVISTHGYTGVRHLLLGSVAENLVRHAPCPVLVVRENEHEFVENAG